LQKGRITPLAEGPISQVKTSPKSANNVTVKQGSYYVSQ